MEQNVGTVDRLVRAGIALILIVFMVRSGRITLAAAISLVAGGMLLSSAASGTCPLYTELGISTAGEEKKKA
ncbi:MAG TPA: DUF2892 domain-containing protein [Deltaproteobacteria bacterium]|nr:DUF2892 domain-containing protein [Deltaproteobacteria bacterium]